MDALDKLKAEGIDPISIICVLDRQTGGFENLKAAGHELLSVFTMEDIDGAP